MRLLVISHTPHYRRGDIVVGWGPTIRELSKLALRFTDVRHIACLHEDEAPASALPYSQPVTLVPVRPVGGSSLADKIDVLRVIPTYARVINRELANADFVHVRAPANIAMVAMASLALRRRPRARWFKYAGNWMPTAIDNPSYRAQRWWLARHAPPGIVTVNGAWPNQPSWIRTFYNPSLEATELERGARIAASKHLGSPIRLLYVGQLTVSKGGGRAIEVVAALRDRGVAAKLEIVGDGVDRSAFESLVRARRLESCVHFAGWKPPDEVHEGYARAHILLFPSASEGWPKVLSEGMAYGVVPIASDVSSIPQYLAQFELGAAIPADQIQHFADVIEEYARDGARWARESARAVTSARLFSFDHYLDSVDELMAELT